MTPNEIETFTKFLSESFKDGIYSRELRLTNEEMEFLKRKYPTANLKECSTKRCLDGKVWYEVNLLTSISSQKETSDAKESAVGMA